MHVYYPSCSFNMLDPVSAKELRSYAGSKDMEIAGCCQYDRRTPSDDITAVYFCQRCRETVEEKGFRTVSFWELINNDPEFVFPDYSGMHVSLQDCWRDREHPEIHEAVRSLLGKMHITYEEAPRNREHSAYCGTLHFETVLHQDTVHQCDHLTRLDKNIQVQLMKENVQSHPIQPVVCVCCRCYNGILLGEGHPVHLMTLLMNQYRGREETLEAHALDLLSRPDPRYNRKTANG